MSILDYKHFAIARKHCKSGRFIAVMALTILSGCSLLSPPPPRASMTAVQVVYGTVTAVEEVVPSTNYTGTGIGAILGGLSGQHRSDRQKVSRALVGALIGRGWDAMQQKQNTMVVVTIDTRRGRRQLSVPAQYVATPPDVGDCLEVEMSRHQLAWRPVSPQLCPTI